MKNDINWNQHWAGSFYGSVNVKWLVICCELPVYKVSSLIGAFLPEVVANRTSVQTVHHLNDKNVSELEFKAAKGTHVTEMTRDAGEAFSKSYEDWYQSHNE